MNIEEHAAKPLLAAAGIATPPSRVAESGDAAAAAVAELGPCMIKAQVPAGRRGKAGGIKAAEDPEAARSAAAEILAMNIAGHRVERVLVERRAEIAREFYAAVLNDPQSRGPLIMFSTAGGMDIEESARRYPEKLRRIEVDIRRGPERMPLLSRLEGPELEAASANAVADLLAMLYSVYRTHDAELLEVNPLALLADGSLSALDCKLVLDDSSAKRQPELAALARPDPLSALERRAGEAGLKFIELEGEVGVLANGAGLTMATMDVIAHHGGRPANFLEIGGEAYTMARPALELVLANERVKSLVVNFCGAFARTDVMTKGVIDAWLDLSPSIPVFFSIRGTGWREAVAMLRERLGIEPRDTMDDAIRAAVEAARPPTAGTPA